MYPWISRTLDFWRQFCEKKCGLYMDVYGTLIAMWLIVEEATDQAKFFWQEGKIRVPKKKAKEESLK